MGDHAFLKVMPKRGVVRFSKRWKVAPRYIRPFEVLERVGTVSYRLVLPLSLSAVHEVFHVSMLRKYTPYPTHVVDWGEITIDTNGTFEEGPVSILDSQDQVLRRKTVRFVKPPPPLGRLIGPRHCVELGLFNLYLPFFINKKNIYIYIISTTVVVFMFYTLSPLTSQYTKLIPIPKIQRLRKHCGEHLSLSWPALLMWDVLSSILVFYFCTYTD